MKPFQTSNKRIVKQSILKTLIILTKTKKEIKIQNKQKKRKISKQKKITLLK